MKSGAAREATIHLWARRSDQFDIFIVPRWIWVLVSTKTEDNSKQTCITIGRAKENFAQAKTENNINIPSQAMHKIFQLELHDRLRLSCHH